MPLTIKTIEGAAEDFEMLLELVDDNGEVRLRGRDALGDSHLIGTFTQTGLRLEAGLSADLGWPLDGDGKLLIV